MNFRVSFGCSLVMMNFLVDSKSSRGDDFEVCDKIDRLKSIENSFFEIKKFIENFVFLVFQYKFPLKIKLGKIGFLLNKYDVHKHIHLLGWWMVTFVTLLS